MPQAESSGQCAEITAEHLPIEREHPVWYLPFAAGYLYFISHLIYIFLCALPIEENKTGHICAETLKFVKIFVDFYKL